MTSQFAVHTSRTATCLPPLPPSPLVKLLPRQLSSNCVDSNAPSNSDRVPLRRPQDDYMASGHGRQQTERRPPGRAFSAAVHSQHEGFPRSRDASAIFGASDAASHRRNVSTSTSATNSTTTSFPRFSNEIAREAAGSSLHSRTTSFESMAEVGHNKVAALANRHVSDDNDACDNEEVVEQLAAPRRIDSVPLFVKLPIDIKGKRKAANQDEASDSSVAFELARDQSTASPSQALIAAEPISSTSGHQTESGSSAYASAHSSPEVFATHNSLIDNTAHLSYPPSLEPITDPSRSATPVGATRLPNGSLKISDLLRKQYESGYRSELGKTDVAPCSTTPEETAFANIVAAPLSLTLTPSRESGIMVTVETEQRRSSTVPPSPQRQDSLDQAPPIMAALLDADMPLTPIAFQTGPPSILEPTSPIIGGRFPSYFGTVNAPPSSPMAPSSPLSFRSYNLAGDTSLSPQETAAGKRVQGASPTPSPRTSFFDSERIIKPLLTNSIKRRSNQRESPLSSPPISPQYTPLSTTPPSTARQHAARNSVAWPYATSVEPREMLWHPNEYVGPPRRSKTMSVSSFADLVEPFRRRSNSAGDLLARRQSVTGSPFQSSGLGSSQEQLSHFKLPLHTRASTGDLKNLVDSSPLIGNLRINDERNAVNEQRSAVFAAPRATAASSSLSPPSAEAHPHAARAATTSDVRSPPQPQPVKRAGSKSGFFGRSNNRRSLSMHSISSIFSPRPRTPPDSRKAESGQTSPSLSIFDPVQLAHDQYRSVSPDYGGSIPKKQDKAQAGSSATASPSAALTMSPHSRSPLSSRLGLPAKPSSYQVSRTSSVAIAISDDKPTRRLSLARRSRSDATAAHVDGRGVTHDVSTSAASVGINTLPVLTIDTSGPDLEMEIERSHLRQLAGRQVRRDADYRAKLVHKFGSIPVSLDRIVERQAA